MSSARHKEGVGIIVLRRKVVIYGLVAVENKLEIRSYPFSWYEKKPRLFSSAFEYMGTPSSCNPITHMATFYQVIGTMDAMMAHTTGTKLSLY
jgi:hypothetical protein